MELFRASASRKRTALVGLTAAVLMGTAACGGDSGGASAGEGMPDTIKMVSINPTTGVIAFVGNSANDGYKLAVKEINDQDFLGSTDIELEFADTKSESQTAAQELSKTIADRDVAAVFGSVSSAEALAMSPLAQKAGLPIMYTQAGSDGVLVGDYTYRATPLMKEYYGNLRKWLIDSGWKSIGIMYGEAFPSVQGVGKDTLPALCEELGIEVVASLGTQPTTQDFTAPVQQLLDADPDGVAILQSGVPNVTIMSQLRQSGYDGPVVGNPGASGGVLTPAGKDGVGMVWPTDFDPALTGASTQDFVKAYEAEYGETPNNYAAEAYDAAWFMAKSYKEADSADREKVKDAMSVVADETSDGALGEGLTWKDNEIQVPGVVVNWNGTSTDLLYAGTGE